MDPFRQVVFPNRVRERRLAHGHARLLAFAALVPEIPYIRLSKIERGEVFARADELARIADAIGIAATDLLLDVDAPGFDIGEWFGPFAGAGVSDDPDEARFALLLAAAVRRQRDVVPTLTAASLASDHGLAPVVLSRIENAQKGLSRWSADIVAALCALFDVPDAAALRRVVEQLHADALLDPYLTAIADPAERQARTSRRIAALRADLRRAATDLPPARPVGFRPAAAPGDALRPRLVPVHGSPADAPGGIVLLPTGDAVEAPSGTGPRGFAVRIVRAVLGPGLPAGTVAIVDPDRRPHAGGLALVRDGEVHRVMAVLLDRNGALTGYAMHPERELVLDALPPGDAAAVIAAHFA